MRSGASVAETCACLGASIYQFPGIMAVGARRPRAERLRSKSIGRPSKSNGAILGHSATDPVLNRLSCEDPCSSDPGRTSNVPSNESIG